MKSPAPQDRPTLDAARRLSWKGWLLQEWGILLLAAVLAVIVWQITAAKVIVDHTIGQVRVELFVAEADRERIGAVLETEGATTTVTLRGSERARFAVLEALCATGGGQPVLRLRIDPAVADTDQGFRTLSTTADAWMWPVDNAAELGLRATRPPARVYLIERQQQGAIAQPALTPRSRQVADAKSIEVQIEISRTTFAYLAPEQIVAGAKGQPALLEPDPLNLVDILELESEDVPYDRPLRFDLSFNGWRDAASVAATPRPYVRNYRRRLPLPKVQATVTLRQIGEQGNEGKGYTQNTLVVQLDPRYEWDIENFGDADILRGSTLSDWQFFGTLVGPKDLLLQIRERKDQWNWQLWVDAPTGGWPTRPMTDEDPKWVETTGKIHWVTKNREWWGQGIHFRPTDAQQYINLKVKLRK